MKFPTAQNIRGALALFSYGRMQLDMGYWLGMTRETSGIYGIGAFPFPKQMCCPSKIETSPQQPSLSQLFDVEVKSIFANCVPSMEVKVYTLSIINLKAMSLQYSIYKH